MRKIILLTLLLAGCSGVPTIPGITPYKIDIQQGNYVTQDMVAKLKPGMTRPQVRFILGTPLVVDMFRTNRWDYVYLYEKRGQLTEQRKMTVIFENDKLARIEGDVVPASAAGKANNSAGGAGKSRPAPAAAAPKPESPAAAPKPESPAAAPAPEGSGPAATSGEPVKTEAPKADPGDSGSVAEQPKQEKPEEEKPREDKPREEKGFFGRMLDKIGL